MPEMTGIERLRELADAVPGSVWANTSSSYNNKYGLSFDNTGGSFSDLLRQISDQIEDEQEERVTRRVEDREAAGWVRAHGGLDAVRAKWRSMIPRARVEHMAERQRERLERIAALNKTIDEMRPRLMPEGMEWPCYEDGEPVRIGDEVVDEAEELVYRVSETAFSDGYGTCLRYEDQRDGNSYNFIDGLEPGERVKRPAPKVLDADGVEIRKGDTVYQMGCKYRVSHLHGANDYVRIVYENSGRWVDPKTLTHRAPVLAADGKPLEVGQTVWGVKDGKGFVVVRPSCGNGLTFLKYRTESGGYVYTADEPEHLTHERPVADTWERLAEDATISPEAYCAKRGIDFSDVDGQHRVLDEVTERMARDLVRRARALAERGQ